MNGPPVLKCGSAPRRQTIRKGIYFLPNLLTTSALFAGFYAVVAAMDSNFEKAAIAIFIAMFMDGLDGRVARLTSTESDFGKEYDSLADMVSFGLAPALVVYEWGGEALREIGWAWGKFGWLAAFFYAVCAAFRLARYNTKPGPADKRFFEGLPSPSAAALVAALVWLGTDYNITGAPAFIGAFFFTAAAGALMVSNLLYYSGKEFNLGTRVSFAFLLVIPAVFMLISLEPPLVLFLLAFGYAASGPILGIYRMARRRNGRPDIIAAAAKDTDDHSEAA